MREIFFKTISVVVAAITVMCVLSTAVIGADSMDIVVSSAESSAGEEVTVTVSLVNNPGISSLKLKLAYGTDLTLQSVTYNTEMGGQTIQPQTLASPVTLMWVRPFDEFVGDAVFATLVFKVSDSTQSGTTSDITVTYDPNDIYNMEEENIPCSVQNGKVTIPGSVVDELQFISAKENTRIDHENKYIFSGVWGAENWSSLIVSESAANISVIPNAEGFIGTGSIINVSSSGKTTAYKVIIIGDLNGDSVCDVLDAAFVANVLNKKAVASSEAICAATQSIGEEIKISDYQNIVNWVVSDQMQINTKCTVTFEDYDGVVLKTEEVEAGGSAMPPENPVRDGYVFTGWDKSIDNISKEETLTAQYAEVDGPTFAVEHVNAVAGSENVAVTISVLNNPGIASIGMRVAFDEALTLTGIEYNTDMGGQSVPPQNYSNPAKLTWVSPFENTTGDKVFATLYFTVSETATGELPVEITYIADDVYDMTETNIPFSIVNNSVLVIK